MILRFTNKTGLEVKAYYPEPSHFKISEKLFVKMIRGRR